MKALRANFFQSTPPQAKTVRNRNFAMPFEPRNSLKTGPRVRSLPDDLRPNFATQPCAHQSSPRSTRKKSAKQKFAYAIRTQQMVANTAKAPGSCTPIPSLPFDELRMRPVALPSLASLSRTCYRGRRHSQTRESISISRTFNDA